MANIPSSPVLVTLMMEVLSSSGMYVHEPYGVTSQKTPFFIITGVKTSNLTSLYTSYTEFKTMQ
jgi:hypothetical protein